MAFHYRIFESPVGKLFLVASKSHLVGVIFEENWKKLNSRYGPLVDGGSNVLERTELQIGEYFDGKLQKFNLPLKMCFGTDFQRRVWSYLSEIPYGKTLSYQEMARLSEHPKAYRAVGTVLSRNPLVIVLPCHRVIGKDGHSSGYTGGKEKKLFLLSLEKWNSNSNYIKGINAR